MRVEGEIEVMKVLLRRQTSMSGLDPGKAPRRWSVPPHAHAQIVSIDTAAAEAHPGVLTVLTGAQAAATCTGPFRAAMPGKSSNQPKVFSPASEAPVGNCRKVLK
jgi:CO/xanthine dehydrogenase Mo-binding subunit